jgi:nucleotide-binding universal stress UspA family protein
MTKDDLSLAEAKRRFGLVNRETEGDESSTGALGGAFEEGAMSRSIRGTKVFSNEREIVVGVDGSKYSKDALTWAVREAKLREAVLRPICVAPIGSDVALDWVEDTSVAESQAIVDEAVEIADALEPTVVVRGEVLVGPVAETLVGASEVTDLLVIGARGGGALSEFLLGSVSLVCARQSRCPVVIVHELARPFPQGSPSRIVVEVEQGRGLPSIGPLAKQDFGQPTWRPSSIVRPQAPMKALHLRPRSATNWRPRPQASPRRTSGTEPTVLSSRRGLGVSRP